jgi:DNA-binding NarL/FixJ family response regulator
MIADDHDVIVAGIKSTIPRYRNLECVGSATNGHEVVGLAIRLRPDVAVVDLAMPLCDGLETRLFTAKPQPILVCDRLRAMERERSIAMDREHQAHEGRN